MVPPSSDRIPRARPYSGSCWLAPLFAYMALTFFGVLSHTLQLDSAILVLVRNPNGISTAGLASSAFARHY